MMGGNGSSHAWNPGRVDDKTIRDIGEGERKREELLSIIARRPKQLASWERPLERKTTLARMTVHDIEAS
jgi:hypothetical protein